MRRSGAGGGVASVGLALLLSVVAASCGDRVQGPEDGTAPVSVAVRASIESAPGTANQQADDVLGEVFRQADTVRVRLARSGTADLLADRELSFDPDGGGAELEIEVELEEDEEVATDLRLVLRQGQDPLFDGSEGVTLVAGETTEVEVTLEPVAAALEVRDEPLTFEAPGDTARLESTLLFATGDTIPGAEAEWSGGDPGVAEVLPDGTVIARGPGETEATATFQDLTDSVAITVEANDPPSASIASPADGATFQEGDAITFEGSATDPEDGDLTGDALTWESDVDGEIGTGETFTRSDLTPAVHAIRLIATDADGAADTAAIEVTVSAPGSVAGRVAADPDGAALADVRVDLLSGGEPVDSTATDTAGRYRFAEVEPGDYTVRLDTDDLPELGELDPGAERAVSVGIDEEVTGIDFTFLRPLVTARTLVPAGSAAAGDTVEVALELEIARVDRPVGGVTADLSWDGGVAAFVAESAAFPGWDTGAANLREAGLLGVSALAAGGLQPEAGGILEVVVFDLSADAAGETGIVPTLRELELIDPDTGRTFDLLSAAVVTIEAASLTVQ